mmetsp:Transcript_26804/g.70387  ORF Transcript_26804/g.70387 Transcript_26804/m.70387 type:complete len:111 (-) Transcript_26804:143-475(-)|eukprot:CAMPEP_0182919748 /NCGR_PEP_ID=MMETSP0105_2-20130417/2952_1 /TAXON_ID=81532 ORGANISM="Acanthoeca-like sp., Strain 10tr" /NCGR_SAMPLE_ID=MMETSP0105_2 /ASSEMBLY_ACC=CAM_ASM_000205 /LENGTH=110 /DNA_ID=CAMNT_0025057003 /DNA_START=355 /DNA_END=687 /DNA_ORIENTATION=+
MPKDEKPRKPTRCPEGWEWKKAPELYSAATLEPKIVADRKMKDAIQRSGVDPSDCIAEALQYAVSRGDMRAVENLLKQKGDLSKFDYVPPKPADEFYVDKIEPEEVSKKK